ncbi:MAG: helix-turn-helix transcriptional regulator [Deltaproteobacteria bacterium]|nr:helix-turn-helix transcriptional regulator [Deltaproteobacteria bacterium]MBW2530969.1 helix-turn-helix transcriptional regulator [Deltaproteobacteria bacterium]
MTEPPPAFDRRRAGHPADAARLHLRQEETTRPVSGSVSSAFPSAWQQAVKIVEALGAPAALLSEDRRRAHLNAPAAAQGLTARRFLELGTAALHPSAGLDGAVCAREHRSTHGRWSASLCVPLEVGGHSFSLCILSLCLRMAAGPVRVAERPAILDELAPRYARVAELLLLGLSDKEIAAQLALSYNTVRTYVRVVLKRAGVHSRAEFIYKAHPNDSEPSR